jgi:hypothetical protein
MPVKKALVTAGVLMLRPKKPVTGTVPPKLRSSGDTHGVAPETVMQELEAAGFEYLQLVRDWPGGPLSRPGPQPEVSFPPSHCYEPSARSSNRFISAICAAAASVRPS